MGSTLGQEGPLEKEMATHSCILAWKVPWVLINWLTGTDQAADRCFSSGWQALIAWMRMRLPRD